MSILDEPLVSLAEAARRLPRRRGGKRTHPATLYRWSTGGCRGVVLETVQVGATRCTSVEALGRFFRRLTEARAFPPPDAAPAPTAADRHDLVEAELEREGL